MIKSGVRAGCPVRYGSGLLVRKLSIARAKQHATNLLLVKQSNSWNTRFIFFFFFQLNSFFISIRIRTFRYRVNVNNISRTFQQNDRECVRRWILWTPFIIATIFAYRIRFERNVRIWIMSKFGLSCRTCPPETSTDVYRDMVKCCCNANKSFSINAIF